MVPPGEVTAARRASAPSSDVGEEGGGPEQRLHAEGLAHVAGQAGEHAGLDQRLGHRKT